MKREEFEAMYRNSFPKLREYVARNVDGEDVNDILQEIYALAWEKWEKVKECKCDMGWLMKTAQNKFKERWKKKSREPLYFDEMEWVEGSDAERQGMLETLLFLEQYLTPWEYRILLEVYLEGRSVREVAAREGISTEGMRWRLNKAKQKLQECVKNKNASEL